VQKKKLLLVLNQIANKLVVTKIRNALMDHALKKRKKKTVKVRAVRRKLNFA
jgi:hypothetical protein